MVMLTITAFAVRAAPVPLKPDDQFVSPVQSDGTGRRVSICYADDGGPEHSSQQLAKRPETTNGTWTSVEKTRNEDPEVCTAAISIPLTTNANGKTRSSPRRKRRRAKTSRTESFVR